MEQPSFDIESLSRDTGGRPQAQSNSTMVGAPADDVHAKICKIVSLLSQALVLTLSLMKAMVSTREVVSDNRIEHMRDAEQQSLLPAHGQLDLPDPVDTTRSRRHMATGNITFTRGQGSWSGYAGADVDAFGIL